MNIAIDARSAVWYKGTGMGTYTSQLIENVLNKDDKNKYSLLLPHNIWCDVLPKYNVNSNIFDFWERVYKSPLYPKEDSSIIHIPHNGIGLSYQNNLPCIVTIHDMIPYIYPELCGSIYKDIFTKEMPKIVEKASHIIAVSENTKRDIIDILNVPNDKITVISEGASKMFIPLDKDTVRLYLRRKYHIKNDYLLYIGGFNRRKNVKLLIEAFSKLIDDHNKDLSLVLVGQRGKQYEELMNYAKELNVYHRVVFTGFVPSWDLPYFYNGANVFVYPSIYEGFGLPPLEAMSCGTPTIALGNSSIREIVGDGGILIDNKLSSLTENILKIIDDDNLYYDLSKKAYNHSKKYSWEKVALDTIQLYEKVCQEK